MGVALACSLHVFTVGGILPDTQVIGAMAICILKTVLHPACHAPPAQAHEALRVAREALYRLQALAELLSKELQRRRSSAAASVGAATGGSISSRRRGGSEGRGHGSSGSGSRSRGGCSSQRKCAADRGPAAGAACHARCQAQAGGPARALPLLRPLLHRWALAVWKGGAVLMHTQRAVVTEHNAAAAATEVQWCCSCACLQCAVGCPSRRAPLSLTQCTMPFVSMPPCSARRPVQQAGRLGQPAAPAALPMRQEDAALQVRPARGAAMLSCALLLCALLPCQA